MSPIKYKDGDYIGPNHIKLIKRTKKKQQHQYALFECPLCHRTDWETRLDGITSGRIKSCNCQRAYKENTLIGPYQIKFIKRLTKDNTNTNYIGLFECPFCHNTFKTAINNITSGHTSSDGCQKSKGELIIREYLEELQLKYFKEYIFKDCINPKTGAYLRFDFYLPDYNCCIEYDGIQHYLGWNNNKKDLLTIQERDYIKTKYCYNNNIKLIRISYTDFNILTKEYILDRISK